MKFTTDKEMFACMKAELYSAVITDVMDGMGLDHQFLPPAIRPLMDDMIIAGRAFTVQEADCCGDHVAAHDDKKEAFGIMFEALDSLKEDSIYCCTGSSYNYACFGELMCTRAKHLKAAGAVIDGYVRDTRMLKKMGVPIFSAGTYAQDQGIRGRVIDYNCPIEFKNRVRVNPGDILFGDIDGVVAIPHEHETEVLTKALEKVHGENKVRDAIRAGMPTVEAFRTFGIM